MRNRKVQREMRRTVGKEEKLDLYDYCGIKDPTPYEAVKRIIREEQVKRRMARVYLKIPTTLFYSTKKPHLLSLAFHGGVRRSCALQLALFGEYPSIFDFSDTP